MTTVFLADDHPMIRTAITVMLDGSEFTLAGTATTGAETLKALGRTSADILLLDVRMPDGSGLDVLRQIRATGRGRKVVLLTAAIDDGTLADSIRLGVDGIVLKHAEPRALLQCLEAVRDGENWFDPNLKDRVARLETAAGRRSILSPRERDLVALVRKGLRNRDIASQLGVTEGTVKVYLHAVFDKTGVANRTELAMKADMLIGPEDGSH